MLFLFALAAIVAMKFPATGLWICVCCLIVYLEHDVFIRKRTLSF